MILWKARRITRSAALWVMARTSCHCYSDAHPLHDGGQYCALCKSLLCSPVAGAAFALNCQLNQIDPLPFHPENLIDEDARCWDLIVLGDMFYDEQLADSLHRWLRRCMEQHGTTVLIGDPGRGHFLGHPIQKQLRQVAQYHLPESSKRENYGLSTSAVWKYEPGGP